LDAIRQTLRSAVRGLVNVIAYVPVFDVTAFEFASYENSRIQDHVPNMDAGPFTTPVASTEIPLVATPFTDADAPVSLVWPARKALR
jgi:hypothetical protein